MSSIDKQKKILLNLYAKSRFNKMTRLLFLLCFSCFLKITFQLSTPQDTSYVAGVVEFAVTRNDFEGNINNYVQFIQQASQENVDIIAFPEMTLMNNTQSAKVPIHGQLQQYPIPALHPDLYDESLVRLSAAARQYQIYVVVNIREEMNCTDAPGEYCPEEKVYMFNTNIVFDRTGALIDRYRKINLFGEYSHTPALRPDLGIFETDFGVTFGHFICFDLMFQVPAVQVVQKPKLTDIIFTTMWFSEMPYLTAVQIQEAYAYAMNVNFIASGANNVAVGSAGSGIYSGKAGALVSIMPGVRTSRLLVARVPKVPGNVIDKPIGPIYDNPANHDQLRLISDPSLPSHITRPLVQGFQEFTLVDKDVSCKFTVRLNLEGGETAPRFLAFIQDGSNIYARREVNVASCAIIACKDDDPKSCVYRYNSTTTNVEITELEIKMTSYRNQFNNTLGCDNVIYYPISLTTSKFPLEPKNFTLDDTRQYGGQHLQDGGQQSQDGDDKSLIENYVFSDSSREHIKIKINKPQQGLITFGIWGRVYTKDVDHNKEVTEQDINKYNNMLDIIFGNIDDY